MSFSYHQVPKNLFDALAAGGGGRDAIKTLAAARYSKHLVLLRGVLAIADVAGPRQARLARNGYDLLVTLQRQDPAAARQAIMHPSIGSWAIRAIRQSGGTPASPVARPGRLSAVAVAAAIRARMPVEIEVDASDGGVLLPALGQAVLNDHTAVVRATGGGAEVSAGHHRVEVPPNPYCDAPGWLGLRRLKAGPLDVIIDDLDPFRMPASANLAPRLSPAERGKLSAMLRDASQLLDAYHPAIAAEVAEAVVMVVPLSNERGGQASSSSSATFGAVALSEPPDPYTCAATLAHEVQHLKMSALLDVVDLTWPGDGDAYYAPWRDDPRPIEGLLQGAYAFLGVTAFWHRQRHLMNGEVGLKAHTEFARWRTATAGAINTLLASGRLTAAGEDFTRGMAHAVHALQAEPIPAEAEAEARYEAAKHLARWEAKNGPVPV
jgi:uncharacterized protein